MNTWPRSAKHTVAALTLTWLASLVLVWWSTSDNYMEVGKNYGSIDERYKTIERLRQLTTLEKCADWETDTRVVSFISVKGDGIRALKGADGSLRFCER